jgi:hypothetical protein
MQRFFRSGFYAGLFAALVFGVYLMRLWGPERQVRLHSEHLIRSLEDRDWSRFSSFVGDSYKDQWGEDRTVVVQRCQAVFGYLRGIRIVPKGVEIQAGGGAGFWRAKINIEGAENSELASVVRERVNRLPSPFTLEWRQVSGKPWDWKLVRVSNETLELPQGYDQLP